jgi:3-dehydroquinate dehydratase-2
LFCDDFDTFVLTGSFSQAPCWSACCFPIGSLRGPCDGAQRVCRRAGSELGIRIEFRQTNAEHELIGWVHEAREVAAGIVINPAGYSHSSVALMDALAACPCPILEVHISNIHRREEFRHFSYVSRVAAGVICGCGTHGYTLALRHLARLLEKTPT